MSLRQAEEEWRVDSSTLYKLEIAGDLLGIRIGNRVWFSRARLVQLLGEPTNPDRPTRLKRLAQSDDVSGR